MVAAVVVGEIVGPHKSGAVDGNRQLFQQQRGVTQIEQAHIQLAYMESVPQLRGEYRLRHAQNIVIGARQKGVVREPEFLRVCLGIFLRHVFKRAEKHGVVVGLLGHPRGHDSHHGTENHQCCGWNDGRQKTSLSPEREQKGNADADNGNQRRRDVGELRPTVKQGRKAEQSEPQHTVPLAQQTDERDRHGQHSDDLHRLAVKGIEVGDISHVAEHNQHRQLDGQINRHTGQSESVKQAPQQQCVEDTVQHAQISQRIDPSVARQLADSKGQHHRGADKQMVDGRIVVKELCGKKQVLELFQRRGALQCNLIARQKEKGGVPVDILEMIGVNHPIKIAVVGKPDHLTRVQRAKHDGKGQGR